MTPWLVLLVAYLAGGIPFGYLLVRLKTGQDVRSMGSGNIGATNVLRNTGRAMGILTLALDIAKGYFAVWLMDRVSAGSVDWMSAAAVAVLLGHAFPIYLKFKGGKAVASFLGANLYLAPAPLLGAALIIVAVIAVTRYVSLGCLVGIVLYPFGCWLILHPAWPLLASAAFSAALIVSRHRGNIERLRAGTENVLRFGGSKS